MDEPAKVTTTLIFDAETWHQARRLAELRARLRGGKPSVSAVVRDLVKAAAEAPQKETGQ